MDLTWTLEGLTLHFVAPEDGPVALADVRPAGVARVGTPNRAHQPLVEIVVPGLGNRSAYNSGRFSGTELGERLRLVRHAEHRERAATRLTIEQADPSTGLRVTSTLTVADGTRAVRSSTTVILDDDRDALEVWAVSSFCTGAVISDAVADVDVWTGRSTWAAEHRWSAEPLRPAGLADVAPAVRGPYQRGALVRTSVSAWSSGTFVPAGAVSNRRTGVTLAWQVEHNGGWHWEVGERTGGTGGPLPVGRAEAAGPPTPDVSTDGAYVAVLGPTDLHHQWSLRLAPGAGFTTVPVTCAVAGSFDDAFAELARHRRRTRRDHPQNVSLPVVFNDYMNTLEGDPTEAKLLPLIGAAAEVGAECFCIDAGWYDDTAGWWASVGDWEPSTVRFPHGLSTVVEAITSEGLVPGLWLEPEVVGVTSRAADHLPAEAFLRRGGVRLRERDRYFLDLRSRAARAHLDRCVDRLVEDLGVGFFKFDFNVTPGPGADGASSAGHALLEHHRALVDWLGQVLDRHPGLMIENCGSGALRSDFAMLGTLQLQSTSDQQDPRLYPAIAVGALVHVLPEQAGHWAYPQAEMSDEQIAFTMCTGLAGRLYQAGLIDRMNTDQRRLVADGVRAHRATRSVLARSVPRFPTGLPSWDDPWVSVAFEAPEETLVIAWRQQHAPAAVTLRLPGARDRRLTQVYPDPDRLGPWTAETTDDGFVVTGPTGTAAARMWRVSERRA